MIRPARPLLPLLALVIGLAAATGPGRAQTAASSRFAFADTTLLRDTLGLEFSDLFRMADSLSLTPDTLRAWMIRYRLTTRRLVVVADSLGMPVDSVGPVLERERFNPLAARSTGRPINTLQYNSSYDLRQSVSVWTNSADWRLQQGQVFVTNNTSVVIDRTSRAGLTTVRHSRGSHTELGWKFSDNFSAGSRIQLDGFRSNDPANTGQATFDDVGKYELTLRSRQKPNPRTSTELNFSAGALDNRKSESLKRGLNSQVDGRMRYVSRRFTQDLTGVVTGNLANSRLPGSLVNQATQDYSASARGTVGLFPSSPVGVNVNLAFQKSRVENPIITPVTQVDSITQILTQSNRVDATLRARRDDERYLNLSGGWSGTINNLGSSDALSGTATLRWLLLGWATDATWRENASTNRHPRTLTGTYGYDDTPTGRSAEVTLQRVFGRFIGRVNGSIGLDRSRYERTSPDATLPVDRDSYRQSVRLETVFTRDEKLTTTLAGQTNLTSSINIPKSASSSSFDTRSYLAEWRWSYRILRGLAVTQSNQLQADYRIYPFTPNLNDLGLSYNSNTALQASLTPRLQLEVQHNARQQPRGSYLPIGTTGLYFLPADESKDYTLRVPVTWSPTPALSINVTPEYFASERTGTVNGIETPQRRSRTLLMSGGANLNYPVGRNGHLSGNVRRSFRDDRSTTFNSGVPQITPRAEQDYWTGQLLFSWTP